MIRPFVILGLPRSRTYWLSRFLTYREWACGHEELRHVRSLHDVRSWLSQPCTGTAETALAPFWRLIPAQCRVVVIRRPVDEVLESLAKQGIEGAHLPRLMKRLDAKLDQMSWRVPSLQIQYEHLNNESTCKGIFQFCLPYEFDREHWLRLSRLNLQIRMHELVRYINAYAPQIHGAALEAKAEMMKDLRRWPLH